MINFKKIAIGFGLVSIITLQGLQASKLKECQSEADEETGCIYVQKYYSNGNVEEETIYKNGRSILKKEYYKNGKLRSETPMNNMEYPGLPDGIVKEYYESGKLKSEIPYIVGNKQESVQHGIAKEYYENGKLKSEIPYKHMQKCGGIAKLYYENGQLGSEEPYSEECLVDGIAKRYYENGNIQAEVSYKDDVPNGVVRLYYQNGQLAAEGTLFERRNNGEHKFYLENGKLLGMIRYKNGDIQFAKCGEKNLSDKEAEDIFYELKDYNRELNEFDILAKYCIQ